MDASAGTSSNFDEKVLELSAQIDAFERYSHAHALRIAEIADALAEKLRFGEHDRDILQQAALLHDIGEFAMQRDYIGHERKLSEAEIFDMHRHPVIGEQEITKRGLDRGVALLVRWHHEWFNGGGYPDALMGGEIPLGARFLRVADAYCSMTADRPFRPAVTQAEARQHLIDLAGIEFDPSVVRSFLELDDLSRI